MKRNALVMVLLVSAGTMSAHQTRVSMVAAAQYSGGAAADTPRPSIAERVYRCDVDPRRATIAMAERTASSVGCGVVPTLALTLYACSSSDGTQGSDPRYLVTATPIDIGLSPTGFCIAVDPLDPKGVWWWQPGRTGCQSRSTRPGVFPAQQASVSRTEGDSIQAANAGRAPASASSPCEPLT